MYYRYMSRFTQYVDRIDQFKAYIKALKGVQGCDV